MLRRIRTIIATVVFVLIMALFLDITGVLHRWLGFLAGIQLLPAILAVNVGAIAFVLLLTLVFGRIYCSVICPLGIYQDGVAHLSHLRKKHRYAYSPEHKWARYIVLAIVVLCFVIGLQVVVALLDPYGIFGRFVQNYLSPVYIFGNNLLALICQHFDSYAFYGREVWIRSLPTFIIAGVMIVIVTAHAWRGGRAYCNTICPVGTFLGLFSRFSLFKVKIDTDRCVSCGLCARNCKSSCIDFKNRKIDYSRCVVCGDCIGKCSKSAMSYGLSLPLRASKGTSSPKSDAGRRAFVLGALMAGGSAAYAQGRKKVDGGLAAVSDKTAPKRAVPITPPGSLSAKNMASHCTACQLCVAACPNGVLRPSTAPGTFMQPTSSYERGYCRPECNRCSQVCPAGAIRPVSVEQKTSIQIGHAVWVSGNCLPFAEGVSCGNCARHCPVGAIRMVRVNADDESSPRVPSVDTERCIGCGACEYHCPARPFSAIYVEGNEIHREV